MNSSETLTGLRHFTLGGLRRLRLGLRFGFRLGFGFVFRAMSAATAAGVLRGRRFRFTRLAFVAATAARSGALFIVGDVKTGALKEESAAAADAPLSLLLVAFGAGFIGLGHDALEALELMAARGA
jgi:hypothetical protein